MVKRMHANQYVTSNYVKLSEKSSENGRNYLFDYGYVRLFCIDVV